MFVSPHYLTRNGLVASFRPEKGGNPHNTRDDQETTYGSVFVDAE
jgi:hypothetical protein